MGLKRWFPALFPVQVRDMFRRNDSYRRSLFKPGTCFQVCHCQPDQASMMRKRYPLKKAW
ncbi:hypothetical protein MBAV_002159 [Candidatus Magnetobacterium bavaricum]|uniref:Uncharacterized protein n=1 Tax=Candidatus Magnetobacterium bavaricum TaxID=29290 RepID=A0A0F3GY54_9BACT|nr:hypothetical protein MBAV_002159 [Candidatus Magnetobacterium bavaricum]